MARTEEQKNEDHKRDMKKYREKNKEKLKEQGKERRKADYNRYMNKFYQEKYGITIEEYNSLFEQQNGCCAICEIHQTQLRRKLCVDHNHINGKIRGLLCDTCNRVLGYLDDNKDILYKAFKYLDNFEWYSKNKFYSNLYSFYDEYITFYYNVEIWC